MVGGQDRIVLLDMPVNHPNKLGRQISCRKHTDGVRSTAGASWKLRTARPPKGLSDPLPGDAPLYLASTTSGTDRTSKAHKSARYVILRADYGDGNMRHGDLRGRPSGRSSGGLSHCLGIATSRPPVVCRGVGARASAVSSCPCSTDGPGPGTHIDKWL